MNRSSGSVPLATSAGWASADSDAERGGHGDVGVLKPVGKDDAACGGDFAMRERVEDDATEEETDASEGRLAMSMNPPASSSTQANISSPVAVRHPRPARQATVSAIVKSRHLSLASPALK